MTSLARGTRSTDTRYVADRNSPLAIPVRPWQSVVADIAKLWQPDNAPHQSIIGLTGSGKSYLVTRGLLPLRQHRRVLIIDVKGDDPTLRGFGKPVKKLPTNTKRTFRLSEEKPDAHWYQLRVVDDWDKARVQVRSALQRVYAEGDWTVVIDETRFLTDPRIPSLGLRPHVEQLWLRGRSRRVEVVAMTQAPKWVPSSFYDQPSIVWFGRINDEDAHKRLREVGGLTRADLPLISAIPKRAWLVIGEGGDYRAISQVP